MHTRQHSALGGWWTGEEQSARRGVGRRECVSATHLASSQGEHQRARRQRAVVGDQQQVSCRAAVQKRGAGDQADGVTGKAKSCGCRSHHLGAGHRRHAAEGEHSGVAVQVTQQQLRVFHHSARRGGKLCGRRPRWHFGAPPRIRQCGADTRHEQRSAPAVDGGQASAWRCASPRRELQGGLQRRGGPPPAACQLAVRVSPPLGSWARRGAGACLSTPPAGSRKVASLPESAGLSLAPPPPGASRPDRLLLPITTRRLQTRRWRRLGACRGTGRWKRAATSGGGSHSRSGSLMPGSPLQRGRGGHAASVPRGAAACAGGGWGQRRPHPCSAGS